MTKWHRSFITKIRGDAGILWTKEKKNWWVGRKDLKEEKFKWTRKYFLEEDRAVDNMYKLSRQDKVEIEAKLFVVDTNKS